MPIETGSTSFSAATETPTSTTIAASVAYATEEIGSDAKIGSAIHFGSSVSSISPDAIGRPTSTRLTPPDAGGGFSSTSPELMADLVERAPEGDGALARIQRAARAGQELVEQEDPAGADVEVEQRLELTELVEMAAREHAVHGRRSGQGGALEIAHQPPERTLHAPARRRLLELEGPPADEVGVRRTDAAQDLHVGGTAERAQLEVRAAASDAGRDDEGRGRADAGQPGQPRVDVEHERERSESEERPGRADGSGRDRRHASTVRAPRSREAQGSGPRLKIASGIHEPVARARLGEDVAGPGRIRLEL